MKNGFAVEVSLLVKIISTFLDASAESQFLKL
jgi:hypothetical protein